jgi:hypothetical protein
MDAVRASLKSAEKARPAARSSKTPAKKTAARKREAELCARAFEPCLPTRTTAVPTVANGAGKAGLHLHAVLGSRLASWQEYRRPLSPWLQGQIMTATGAPIGLLFRPVLNSTRKEVAGYPI